ncbi:MAG: 4-hydroxy-tetrahydrodipicolinate synthase [Clostridia bacterium]|nr:4-hydroxy-tetrahydrodipicolinate synthase [Clostridia bacterium]
MPQIKGIIVPIVTPMTDDEEINTDELKRQVERMISAGIHGIFVFGTNGEGYILSENEKKEILSVCIEQVNGRVPVYAGTGCISTAETIRMSRWAEEAGADVLSIITPFFAAASQKEMITHYRKVADSVSCPIVLYNIPARTGNALAPAAVKELSKIPNIVGVKDSSGNFDNILQYIEQTRERENFAVLSGNDSLILWTLLAGGRGGIAGCANVFPENMVAIYEHFIKNEFAQARKAQDAIRPFRNCFRFGNPNTIVKEAVAMLGYPVGKCRSPFNDLSDEAKAAIGKALNDFFHSEVKA